MRPRLRRDDTLMPRCAAERRCRDYYADAAKIYADAERAPPMMSDAEQMPPRLTAAAELL